MLLAPTLLWEWKISPGFAPPPATTLVGLSSLSECVQGPVVPARQLERTHVSGDSWTTAFLPLLHTC